MSLLGVGFWNFFNEDLKVMLFLSRTVKYIVVIVQKYYIITKFSSNS